MEVGIDVVSIPRIARDLERWPGKLLTRVTTDAEARWCLASRSPATRVAACVAIKESVIKAMGGRPLGYTWVGLETRPFGSDRPALNSTLARLAQALETATGAVIESPLECLTDGRTAYAVWGSDGERVYGLAMLEQVA